jgi:hypothetical protein
VVEIRVQARQYAFKCFTMILEEVPAVGNLERSGGTEGCSTGVFGGTVTRNDRDAGMIAEPGSNRFGATVRQQVNRAMLLKIHQNGAVGSALLEGKIINP